MTSHAHLPAAACIAAVASITLALATAPAHALEPDKLFEQVSPGIVTVVALRDESGNSFGFGSGVVIAPQTVITNCHVLQRGKKIIIKTGPATHDARLLFPDVPRDLCQLSVPTLTAPAVALGTAYTLKVGQRVYAIGNPRQLELSLSDGLVSALRDIKDGAPLIQTTTPISPGSSGGGLFDQDGRLIGITTGAKADSQNLNFAHPVDWIAEVPERAKTQIAAYREARSKAPAEPAAAPKQPVQPPQPAMTEKPLTARELENLIQGGRQLTITSGNGVEQLTFSNDGYVNALTSRGRVFSGTYTLSPATGMLCMRYPPGGANLRALIPINDCFVAYRMGERQYRFRAADKTEFIGES